MMTDVLAIVLMIAGIVMWMLWRDRFKRKINDTSVARFQGDFILVLKVATATGCLMFLFELFKIALNSGITIWTSHVIIILFAVLIVAVVTFVVIKIDKRLRPVISLAEERYKLLFEKSLTGAYRTSLDGRVLDCNVSFCQMFGYATREEVIGQSVSVCYPSSEERIQFIKELRAQKRLTNLEQRLQRRDGGALWVLNNAALVAGKAGSGFEIKGTLTDISVIRQAEQEHRRLAAIVSCSEDAILSCTLDGRIETWNAGAERTLGFSAEEAIGKSIAIIAPADRPIEYRQILGKIGSGEKVNGIETTRLKKNGQQIDVSLSVSPIKDAAGNVIGAAAIVLDITDRKRAEEALRNSEEQYRLLFDTNPVPMWVFDRTTLRFLAVNQAAILQYGYTKTEFLAMTVADIRPEEDIPELVKNVERRNHGLQKPDAWRHRRKNGTIVDVEVVCHDLDFHGTDAMLVAAYDVTARKQSEEALLVKTALLEAQSESTIDGILVVDESDRIILANKQFQLHFGIPHELLASRDDRSVLMYVTEQVENPDAFIEKVKHLNKHQYEKGRDEIKLKNGKVFDRYSAPLVDVNGAHRGRIWYFRDITEHKLAESAMRQAEEKYRAIFEDSVLGIFQIAPEGRPISINRALAQLHGYRSPEEFMAEVQNVPAQLFVDPNRMIEVAKQAATGEVVHGAEVEVYCKDRSRKWVRISQRAVRDVYNDIRNYEGTVEDITERKAAEERVQFLAYYDALTELPHRALLQDRLGHALADARRRKEKVALLFLDLDRFKIINDSLGHSLGDIVLKEVAKRLKQCTRAQDTVARVGGDEFLIMLNRVGDVAEAAVAAERVMREMSAEFLIQGHSLRMSCSIGISISPEHGADGETLIKNADAAMYFAKEAGRNGVRFFTGEMDTQAAERLALESNLRLALDRGEFFLVYQPQMEIATGSIIGFEALIRWQHPALGLIPPDRFIPIAENNGFILQIGEWVLRTACAQARQWWDDGLLPVPIAVNVSAIQFRQENFSTLVKNVLFETGLAPEFLELELTESLLMSNEDVMFAVLQELREMGVKLAIDDFGTGYSSLSYLKQFRVNKLKIDRSFIRNIVFDPGDAAITTAIISMANSLNLKVIAEGVEDEAQMSFLRAHGCDEIQGYLFSKPITVDEVFDMLQSQSFAA
ncbi:MAG: PAS domain S-box protein [Terracidiphilus sp.]